MLRYPELPPGDTQQAAQEVRTRVNTANPAQNITDPPIPNPMRYIDTPPDRVHLHNAIEVGITAAYDAILANCPRSAERTLAVRKLQEARMWGNAAIVFDGRTYQT